MNTPRYDSVFVDCTCGQVNEFRSSASPAPYLATYYKTNVPVYLADDLDGKAQPCRHCGATITLRSEPPTHVPMHAKITPAPQAETPPG